MDYSLTPEQEETLLNFQAITENWDTISALETLSRNRWDLTLATQEALNTYPDELIPTYESFPYNPPVPVIKKPEPVRSSGLFSKLKSVFASVQIPIISTSAEEFQQKIRSQPSEFLPNFSNKLLKNMLEEANQVNMVLLMYIDSRSCPSDYLLTVFCNELSVMIINQYYLAWGVDKDTAEGIIADKVLTPRQYPCLAAIKVDNPESPLIIEKLEGLHSSEKVIEFLSRNYVTRPVLPKVNKAIIEERRIRERQDRELKEAERIVKEKQQKEAMEKKEIRIREEMKKKLEEEKENEKRRKMEIIGEEPNGIDVALVSFRLPDGRKVERKFDKLREIQVLYDFIEVQGLINFTLLFGFPSEPLANKETTLESIGIYPKAVVIVRTNEA